MEQIQGLVNWNPPTSKRPSGTLEKFCTWSVENAPVWGGSLCGLSSPGAQGDRAPGPPESTSFDGKFHVQYEV